ALEPRERPPAHARLRAPDDDVAGAVADDGARRAAQVGEDELAARPVGHRLERLRVDHLADVDRKSTRLNSSHDQIWYAVFCLKKKKKKKKNKNKTKIKKNSNKTNLNKINKLYYLNTDKYRN